MTGIYVLYYHYSKIANECSNYRGITLTSTLGKVFTRIIENRLKERLEEALGETQHGFRKGRSTQDLILTMRQLNEKLLSINKEIHIYFVDLQKAFDKIRRSDL